MLTVSVTVCEIFGDKMCLTLTFRMGQGQMQICPSKGHVRLSVLAIECLFYLSSFARYSRMNSPNVLHSNLWPWKLMSRTLANFKLANERILSTCIYVPKLALFGPAVCSRRHFVADVRTYIYTQSFIAQHRLTPVQQLCNKRGQHRSRHTAKCNML